MVTKKKNGKRKQGGKKKKTQNQQQFERDAAFEANFRVQMKKTGLISRLLAFLGRVIRAVVSLFFYRLEKFDFFPGVGYYAPKGWCKAYKDDNYVQAIELAQRSYDRHFDSWLSSWMDQIGLLHVLGVSLRAQFLKTSNQSVAKKMMECETNALKIMNRQSFAAPDLRSPWLADILYSACMYSCYALKFSSLQGREVERLIHLIEMREAFLIKIITRFHTELPILDRHLASDVAWKILDSVLGKDFFR
jgi:hypothetical protein